MGPGLGGVPPGLVGKKHSFLGTKKPRSRGGMATVGGGGDQRQYFSTRYNTTTGKRKRPAA